MEERSNEKNQKLSVRRTVYTIKGDVMEQLGRGNGRAYVSTSHMDLTMSRGHPETRELHQEIPTDLLP